MDKILARAAIGLLAVAALAALAGNISAAPLAQEDTVSFTVSPSQLEFAASPGGAMKQPITVTNHSADPLSLFVSVEDLQPGRPDLSAKSWLRIDQSELTLGPNETKTVNVTLLVPRDAPQGGGYAVVYFQTSKPVAPQQGGRISAGTGVGVRVGSVFMITVKGLDLSIDAVVTKVIPVLVEKGKMGFNIVIENRGNVHFFPKGSVELRDAAGNLIGEIPLAESTSVLPGTTKVLRSAVTLPVTDGDYVAKAKVDYGWQKWQAEVAGIDPAKVEKMQDTAERPFNSVPKLVVKQVETVATPGAPVRVVVVLENQGDVQVEPGGYLEVITKDGKGVFAVPISSGSLGVEPHATQVVQTEYPGLLPKGEYQVNTVLDYGGAEAVSVEQKFDVAKDIVPRQEPTPPSRPPAELTPSGGGPGPWLWVGAGAGFLGVVSGSAATYLVWRRRHLLAGTSGAEARSGAKGGEDEEEGGGRVIRFPKDRSGSQ
ncbi:MAG: hypothetical protein HYY00_05550 [Chloroflexi bacterium]|nr:hypothetical protein [Chloroflexota bacterium]